MSTTPQQLPTPDHILQIGFSFWACKTLLSAVELELFTELARHPLPRTELQGRLGLHPRSAGDFLDAVEGDVRHLPGELAEQLVGQIPVLVLDAEQALELVVYHPRRDSPRLVSRLLLSRKMTSLADAVL